MLRPRGELVERTFRTPTRRVLCGNCIPVDHTIFQVPRLSPRAAKAVKAKVAPQALLSGASSVSPVPLVGRFIVEQAQDRRVDHGLLKIRTGQSRIDEILGGVVNLGMSTPVGPAGWERLRQ